MLYAVVRSICAWSASASAEWSSPPKIPGGNPSIAVPGLTPTSPSITDGPVLVTVDALSTPKLAAVPRPTGPSSGAALAGAAANSNNPTETRATDAVAERAKIGRWIMECLSLRRLKPR